MFIVNTVLLIRNRSTTFAVVFNCFAKIVNFPIIPTNDEDFFCDLTFATKK